MRHLSRKGMLGAALAASLSVVAVATASASAAVTITKITPTSGPEFAGSNVKVKGTGFSTTPGEDHDRLR